MSEPLLQLEIDLRKAVAQHRSADAQRIAATLCAQAAADWQALPPGDPRALHIYNGLMGMLEQAQLMLRIGRSLMAAELHRVVLSNRYLRAGAGSNDHPGFSV